MKKNKLYICDTNIFISAALIYKSNPYTIINFILSNDIFFAFSQETYDELVNVFNRKKFDAYISLEKRNLFIEKIVNSSAFYDSHKKVYICRDVQDNKFLELALASNAELLITGDDDLLVLRKIGETKIITPKEFVEKIL